jgi:hypothetical protein
VDNLIFSIVRNKLEYKSMVRNSVTAADAQQLERNQRKFVALCCVPQTVMAIVTPMFAIFYIYALWVTEDINLAKFFLIMYFFLNHVHIPWTLFVYEVQFGISETFPCFMLVHPSKTVPSPGVPLRQIQVVVTLIPSEGTLSQTDMILVLVSLHKVP